MLVKLNLVKNLVKNSTHAPLSPINGPNYFQTKQNYPYEMCILCVGKQMSAAPIWSKAALQLETHVQSSTV